MVLACRDHFEQFNPPLGRLTEVQKFRNNMHSLSIQLHLDVFSMLSFFFFSYKLKLSCGAANVPKILREQINCRESSCLSNSRRGDTFDGRKTKNVEHIFQGKVKSDWGGNRRLAEFPYIEEEKTTERDEKKFQII